MTAATSPTLFASAGFAPTATDVADDHSLLKLDYELDLLLEQIEDEIEESGEASKQAMDRLQLFCQAMNVKVDRIGRYLAVMKTRAAHCKEEAARYAARAKRAENKIVRTESMVLYYLESHDLKQLETDDFTFRRQKNSQDSVIVRNPQAVPPEFKPLRTKGGRLSLSGGSPGAAGRDGIEPSSVSEVCRAVEYRHQAALRKRQDRRRRGNEASLPFAYGIETGDFGCAGTFHMCAVPHFRSHVYDKPTNRPCGGFRLAAIR